MEKEEEKTKPAIQIPIPIQNQTKPQSQKPNHQSPEKTAEPEKDPEIQRIGISSKANEAIKECMERVNDGFVGGRVNRSQIANWILEQATERITESDIREIRAEHFDEVAALEGLLRQVKGNGAMPAELKALLQKQLQPSDGLKRSGKKPLPNNSITDGVKEGKGDGQ